MILKPDYEETDTFRNINQDSFQDCWPGSLTPVNPCVNEKS